MTDQIALKRAVAAKALDYVVDGMKLGLGSGSTAEMFVEMLAPGCAAGRSCSACRPPRRTAALARKLGLTLSTLDELAPLDLTVDGADEADRNLDLIKGGGGMLLREKIVRGLRKRMVVIADETKLVPRLGSSRCRWKWSSSATRPPPRTSPRARGAGLWRSRRSPCAWRRRAVQDRQRQCDLRLRLRRDPDAPKLAAALSAVPGVVEHGLFIGLATTLLIADPRRGRSHRTGR